MVYRQRTTWSGVVLAALFCSCDAQRQTPVAGGKPAAVIAKRSHEAGPPAPLVVPPQRADDWFANMTDRTGIRFTYFNGREAARFFMIESFGGGVAMIDFDLDDDIDLLFTGGGTISTAEPVRIGGLPSALFRNEGGWRFSDMTSASGLAQAPDYSQGCAVADFNADGFPDLLVCCYGRTRLYENRGDGTFVDSRCAGLPGAEWCTTAAFGDVDGDGFADLFLARYADWVPGRDVVCYGANGARDLCGPKSYAGTTCRLLRNSGTGAFDDWSERVGLQSNVRGLGVVAADLNGDGRVDFYVASDESPNQLYLGKAEFPWDETAIPAGVAVGEFGQPEGSMGIAVGDYDGNGLPDLLVTNFELEDYALYQNLGRGLFMHATAAAGLSGVSRLRSGFGVAFADFDGDGWQDLFVLNGNPIYEVAETPFQQAPKLFRNLGGRFEQITGRGGPYFFESRSGRGTAVGDLDNDGRLDLVTLSVNEPVVILRNQIPVGNFVHVQLHARGGEPDATGALVTTEFEGRALSQFVVRGAGFFSQSDPRLVFPVEAGWDRAEVTVHWPGRAVEVFRRLPARRLQHLVEGRGERTHEPQ